MSRYLVAVSGGPDSMALLDSLKKKNYDLIVAHCNYNKRDSALRDMQIVSRYCTSHGIPLVIKNAFKDEVKGNFQAWARDFRYHFFKEVYDRYHCEGLLIAHQEDDLIETYLMQKEKNLTPYYYGLKAKARLYGMDIYRPFLKLKRSKILEYLNRCHIEYGIDESNLSDDYRRNVLRHQFVEKMRDDERELILQEIEIKNQELKVIEEKIKKVLKGQRKISLKDFEEFDDKVALLRYLLYPDMAKTYIDSLIDSIKSATNFEILIRDKYLVSEYGYLEVYDKVEEYSYSFDKLEFVKEDYFKICTNGKSKQGAMLKDSDFPITIRTFKAGDKIRLHYGTKKVSRFFIDNKIPRKYRRIWPIVENSSNEIILVPGIGPNINHYSIKPNAFVVELLY